VSLPEARSSQTRPVRVARAEELIIRAVGPRDAHRLRDYVRGLSSETRRSRFLGALSELAPTRLDGLIHMLPPREILLLALACSSGHTEIVAEVMLVIGPNSERGEIALSVTDQWQRRGLGTLLLRELETRARAVGARYLFGEVLRTNTAMKCLARQQGYSIRSLFTDARLIEIVKDVSARSEHAPPSDQETTGISPA
jgi:GNAT superfamily N-acetyltransferase